MQQFATRYVVRFFNSLSTKIGRRLIIYILLFSGLITTVLTGMQLFFDYRHEISVIDERFQQISLTNTDTIASHLWRVDYSSILLSLEGLLRVPDVSYVAVLDEARPNQDKIIAEQGQLSTKDIVQRDFRLYFDYRGKQHFLGELKVQISLLGMYDRLLNTLIVMLVSQAIKTFLVSVFILFLVHLLVTERLFRVVDYARRFQLGKQEERKQFLALNYDMQRHDELDQLVEHFDQMGMRIDSAYQQAHESEKQLTKAHTIAKIITFEWDIATDRLQFSSSITSLFPVQQPIPATMQEYLLLIPEAHRATVAARIRYASLTAGQLTIAYPLHFSDGTITYFEHQGESVRDDAYSSNIFLSTLYDITIQQQQRDKLEFQALHDQLTGLPNRAAILSKIDKLLLMTQANFFLAVFAIERLHEIYDSLGYSNGDKLLQQFTSRIADSLYSFQELSRIDGNKFALITDAVVTLDEVDVIVERLIHTLEQPLLVDNIPIQVAIYVGVVHYPTFRDSADGLLRKADIALSNSKHLNKQCSFYEDSFDIFNPRRMMIMSDLHTAADKKQFQLFYQPQIDSHTMQVSGVEALIRWFHPKLGLIPPDDFIPFAEMTNTINTMTLWVMQQAIADLRALHDRGYNITMAINLSPRSLLYPACHSKIKQLLQMYGVEPRFITLEITEHSILGEPELIRKAILELREYGVNFSIDDFGTGHSSLSYIRELAVDELKLDKSFVMDMDKNSDDEVIVRATVSMAHELHLYTVAEGVETQRHVDMLRNMHCNVLQGYYFSKPLPIDALYSWMSQFQQEYVSDTTLSD